MPTLRDVFPNAKDLLALTPEDLGAALIQLLHERKEAHQSFMLEDFDGQLFAVGQDYPGGQRRGVRLALSEAFSWLVTAGIIVRDPEQPAKRYVLTRRGAKLKSTKDIQIFAKGRALPIELLQPVLAEKVHPLFVRGDYAVAVFAAFKEVEIAVRKAGGYADDVLGKDLMSKAFHSERGPLRDITVIPAEREAEFFLFVGAMGHAKNPVSHREVNLNLESAARLIVFASHLLWIVELRELVGPAS